jgi:CYTH domain-containing protein
MIELEKTYLAKSLPAGLEKCKHKEIIDVYIPKAHPHPKIRIRKNGDKYEITKKEPVADDASHQEEQTIKITEFEFNELSKIDGKRLHKLRYYYDYKGRTAEIDVFQEALKGLVLVDFEFETVEDKAKFKMPEFCLVDVTQEKFTAGGMICGKSYEDIAENLKRFNYSKLFLQ